MKRPNQYLVVASVVMLAVFMVLSVVAMAKGQAEAPPPKPPRWQTYGAYNDDSGVEVQIVCDYERKDMIYTATRPQRLDAGVGIFVVPGGCK